MLGTTPGDDIPPATYYSNAKVVLLGNMGAGKSSLFLTLRGLKYKALNPTNEHSAKHFDKRKMLDEEGHIRECEVFLWDFASSFGYRLINQFYVRDATIALVVFDAREQNSLEDIRYWDSMLYSGRHDDRNRKLPLKKFLVMTHAELGGSGISSSGVNSKGIEALRQELHFDAFYITSAKESSEENGWGIPELKAAVRDGVDWNAIPDKSPQTFFDDVSHFITTLKSDNLLLYKEDDLYAAFVQQRENTQSQEIQCALFVRCLKQLQIQNKIYYLDSSDPPFILLAPNMLDDYTSALLKAAQDEPDSFGCIEQTRIFTRDFFVLEDTRIKDRQQEIWLLQALVKHLISYTIALEVMTDRERCLVFLSQPFADSGGAPDLDEMEEKTLILRFKGPTAYVYPVIAACLSHSNQFKRENLRKNTYLFHDKERCSLTF